MEATEDVLKRLKSSWRMLQRLQEALKRFQVSCRRFQTDLRRRF